MRKYKTNPNYVWMRISDDYYELPTAVANSAVELARMCNTTDSNIRSCVAKKSKRYIKVYVGDK